MSKFKTFKKTLLATVIGLLGISQVYASTVRNDVDYQEFRDFAENKGRFTVGASNIEIKDKNGKTLGIALNGEKMPDLSSTNRLTGTGTLVDPQYIVSVAHNEPDEKDAETLKAFHHYTQTFGGQGFNPDAHHYNYAVVDTNSDPKYSSDPNDTENITHDYQTPRLSKLVTEVVPVTTSTVKFTGSNTEQLTQQFKDTYSTLVRVGSGIQNTISANNTSISLLNLGETEDGTTGYVDGCPEQGSDCQFVTTAYEYLTGGNNMPVYSLDDKGVLLTGGVSTANPNLLHNNTTPLTNFESRGDSGSPFYGFNRHTKKWELVGVLQGGTNLETTTPTAAGAYTTIDVVNSHVLIKNDFLAERKREDEVTINNNNANTNYQWSSNGNKSTIGSQTVNLARDNTIEASKTGIEGLTESLNDGKTVKFTGQVGSLTLNNNINQGAGALYFDNNFTVNATKQETTWLGAGVVVADGKTVNWQVKNPENDRLSKLGKGTLHVNGTGENKGDISVGDGTVILNQTGGKAFQEVGIVSGRATVVLANADQVNPNNIYFGHRGGRLDVNGNNLTFQYIQNVDDGANIVNHNGIPAKAATITVTGKPNVIVKTEAFYPKDDENYRLRGKPSLLFPTNKQNNLNWVYVGQANSVTQLIDTYNQQMQTLNTTLTFNGLLGERDKSKINGILNFVYHPTGHGQNLQTGKTEATNATIADKSTLMLSGGSELQGNITAQAGTLLLSGRPTPYAIQYTNHKVDQGGEIIDIVDGKEVIKEHDWLNRTFNATNIIANNNSKLVIGRNVNAINSNITVNNNAVAQVGFINNATTVCIRSDYHGETECTTPNYTNATTLANIPVTQMTGNIDLTERANLTLGKVHVQGKATSTTNTTQTTLSPEARWTMTEDSNVGHLTMQNGSQITLNNATKDTVQKYNTLTVKGNLTGTGQFNYLANMATIQGDKVHVLGNVNGAFNLNITNSGKEPAKTKENLTVFVADGSVNNAPKLLNADNQGTVDLGAFRYELKSDNDKAYYLWSKGLEDKIDADKTKEQSEQELATAKANAKTKADDAVKKAEDALAQAQKAVNDAKNKGLETTQAEAELAKLQQAVNDAKTAQTNANKATTVDEANKALTDATTAQNSLATLQNNVTTALNKAQQQKDDADKAKADELAKKLTDAKNKANDAVKKAEDALAQAQKAIENAKQAGKDTTSAEAKLAELQQAVNDAKTAQTAVNNAKTVEEADTALAQANTASANAATLSQNINDIFIANGQPTTPPATQAESISRYTNTALSEVSAQTNSLIHIANGLNQHLLTAQGSGLWLAGQRYKTTHQSDLYRPYKKDEDVFQLGVGHSFNIEQGKLLLGGAWSQSKADNQYDDNINGEAELNMFSLYSKLSFHDDSFVTADVGYGHSKNEIHSNGQDINFKRNVSTAGVNIGKTFKTKFMDIQPSIGARYHYLSDVNYTLNDAKIHVDDVNLISYRAGVLLEKSIPLSQGLTFKPSLSSYYVDANRDDKSGTVTVNDSYSFKQKFGRYGYHEIGLAFAHSLWEVSLNASHAEGNETDKQQSIGFKLNYKW